MLYMRRLMLHIPKKSVQICINAKIVVPLQAVLHEFCKITN